MPFDVRTYVQDKRIEEFSNMLTLIQESLLSDEMCEHNSRDIGKSSQQLILELDIFVEIGIKRTSHHIQK